MQTIEDQETNLDSKFHRSDYQAITQTDRQSVSESIEVYQKSNESQKQHAGTSQKEATQSNQLDLGEVEGSVSSSSSESVSREDNSIATSYNDVEGNVSGRIISENNETSPSSGTSTSTEPNANTDGLSNESSSEPVKIRFGLKFISVSATVFFT